MTVFCVCHTIAGEIVVLCIVKQDTGPGGIDDIAVNEIII